ncbi:Vta1 like-domain-containing protein [Syncephalis fuscata]|nr:Vta1 like-domain-containing protein [Syncephalis fuscata]
MSSLSIPTDLKLIAPFLIKGNEMQAHDPAIAYFCNVYAAQLAVEKGVTTADSRAFLMDLMGRLEQEKAGLAGHEALENKIVSKAYVEQFALNIFKRADDEDRAGKAGINTARSYQAAAIFLETCTTFGDLDDDISQKIKYAKWRALEILKAVKSGQPVKPPVTLDEINDDIQSDSITVTPLTPAAGITTTTSNSEQEGWQGSYTIDTESTTIGITSDLSDTTSIHATSPVDPSTEWTTSPTLSMPTTSSSINTTTTTTTSQSSIANVAITTMASTTTIPAQVVSNTVNVVPDHKVITATQKHAKFAVSALQYEDISTAVTHLQQALALLQPYLQQSS